MTPNPYVAPVPPPQAPKPNRLPWILAIVGAVLFCFCGIPMGFVAWSASLPESGVRAGNQLDSKTKALVQKKAHLVDDEEIVSFYDTTLKVDGSECAVLTNKRVIYWTSDALSDLNLEEIESITHDQVPLEGDIITVTDVSGRLMKIEIAPLNDGATFLRSLELLTGKKANAKGVAEEAPSHDGPARKRRK
ncbi:MAG: PH domain-containing protein [Myxococcaceae bacterium]